MCVFTLKTHTHTCTQYCKKKQKTNNKTSSLSPPPFPASAYRSYDQMSVSTQYSIQPESHWDPQSESTSMISFDMSRPYSPTSPSKYFKVCFGCNFHIDQNSCTALMLYLTYICFTSTYFNKSYEIAFLFYFKLMQKCKSFSHTDDFRKYLNNYDSH